MKYIGQIYAPNETIKCSRLYKRIDDLSQAYDDLPLLIVGYKISKAYIKDFNILRHHYNKHTFWTFSKYENRSQQEYDLVEYYKYCVNEIVNDVKYIYVNILTWPMDVLKRFIYHIKSQLYVSYSITYDVKERPEFIYLYCPDDNITYGISLSTIRRFTNINIEKIQQRCQTYMNFHEKPFKDNLTKDIRICLKNDNVKKLMFWTKTFGL